MTISELMGERSMVDLVTQLAEGRGPCLCPSFRLRPPCGKLEDCKECWALALSRVEEVRIKCEK